MCRIQEPEPEPRVRGEAAKGPASKEEFVLIDTRNSSDERREERRQ